MEQNKELLNQIKEQLAKECGFKDFRTMAENVNIVPHDVSTIAKRYAEAMLAEQQSRYDELKAENERLKESSILFCNKYSESQTAYAELVDEAQRLVDALKWYADDGNYFGDNEELATAWKKNMAKKANTALQDWQNKEGV